MYGTGAVAKLARFLLSQESPHEVVATAVDEDHLEQAPRLDLPLVSFEKVVESYPPDQFAMFIAVGYSRMNGLRAARYRTAKSMGYELITHVSPRASTWPDIDIGENCLVMDQAVIQPFARVGNDCILWSGSYVGHEAQIGDHCYMAARATVSGLATVGERCFLGTGSITRDGIRIGDRCLVGAGVVMTHDAPPSTIHAAAEPRLLPGRSERLPSF